MLHHLPKEHFHLIHYIIILASNIQQHADVNMMNPEALAIVHPRPKLMITRIFTIGFMGSLFLSGKNS